MEDAWVYLYGHARTLFRQSLILAVAAVAVLTTAVWAVEPGALTTLHAIHALTKGRPYPLAQNIRYQENFVDQLFDSSEKRLARVLLLQAHFGEERPSETVIPEVSLETVADMAGTTRLHVRSFMNRCRKSGFLASSKSGLRIHRSLLNVVLHD
jgi:CRP/FNR family cyclic AMP-dependent transcriptional regulator